MGICMVRYAFEDCVKNVGVAVKIDLSRCQSHKVAGRIQRALWRNEEGKLVYDGDVLRWEGYLYLVAFNVTGSSCSTADDPKFALLTYFEVLEFEAVKNLAKEGGILAGYTPIIQGDIAGPHQEATFK